MVSLLAKARSPSSGVAGSSVLAFECAGEILGSQDGLVACEAVTASLFNVSVFHAACAVPVFTYKARTRRAKSRNADYLL